MQRTVDEALARMRAAGVEIPVPWDARALCDQLASWRGRPVHLVPGSRFGWWHDHLWISGPNADFVVWADKSSPLHQQHGILHEVGHLVLGHSGVPFDAGATRVDDLRDELHARSGYSHPDEAAAECFATTVGVHVFTHPIHTTVSATPEDADAVERLAAALGLAGH